MVLFEELNRDQLTGLSNLCFDIAKGSLGLVFLSMTNLSDNLILGIVRVMFAFLMGLAFTYAALVLLKLKGQIK